MSASEGRDSGADGGRTVRARAETARVHVDRWLDAHPRAHLALFVVVPGAAVALALVTVSGESPGFALFSGLVFGLVYGLLTYYWTDFRTGE